MAMSVEEQERLDVFFRATSNSEHCDLLAKDAALTYQTECLFVFTRECLPEKIIQMKAKLDAIKNVEIKEDQSPFIDSLKEKLTFLLKRKSSMIPRIPAFDKFKKAQQQLAMTFAARKQEVLQFQAELERFMANPMRLEALEKKTLSEASLAEAKQEVLTLQAEFDELDDGGNDSQDQMQKLEQEVQEVEQFISDAKNHINNSTAQSLKEECEALEMKLQALRKMENSEDGGESSTSGFSANNSIDNLNFASKNAFKNPNESPSLLSLLKTPFDRNKIKLDVRRRLLKPNQQMNLVSNSKAASPLVKVSLASDKRRSRIFDLKRKNVESTPVAYKFRSVEFRPSSTLIPGPSVIKVASNDTKSSAEGPVSPSKHVEFAHQNVSQPNESVRGGSSHLEPGLVNKQKSQQKIEILSIEYLPPLKLYSEVLKGNLSSTEDIVEPSDPSHVPYKPRRLDQELEKVNSVAMDIEQKAQNEKSSESHAGPEQNQKVQKKVIGQMSPAVSVLNQSSNISASGSFVANTTGIQDFFMNDGNQNINISFNESGEGNLNFSNDEAGGDRSFEEGNPSNSGFFNIGSPAQKSSSLFF